VEKSMNNLKISVTRDGTYEYPLHCHAHWEIMSYLHGRGVMQTESGNIPFSEGTVICIPPSFLHGSTAKETGFKNISIGTAKLDFPADNPIVLNGQIASEIKNLIGAIYTIYYRDANSNTLAIEKLVEAVSELINTAISQSDTLFLGSIVEKLKNSIVTNFTDCFFSLQNEIALLPYTDDYVRTLFKSATGKTPLRYLTDIRLAHAKNMFSLNPKEKVSRVALASGFSDPLYFTRAYKKRYGVSPTKQKEILQNEKNS
jgi:AraC-like DNA-binding protein